MDVVAVEVAAISVVVLGCQGGGPRDVGRVAVEDLCVPPGTPASMALVIAACRSECGLMCPAMPAVFAIRAAAR